MDVSFYGRPVQDTPLDPFSMMLPDTQLHYPGRRYSTPRHNGWQTIQRIILSLLVTWAIL